MNIGVLGTGAVGAAIGTKLVQGGHQVMMGSRTASNEKARAWAESAGEKACYGTYTEAAQFGELLFNCTAGTGSLDALEQAGRENLKGKILIDIANPLDFSKGFPPSLTVCNTDSLGEQIQHTFPELRVVKTLNTMNCQIMVNPALVPGDHSVFLSGNDAQAKQEVATILSDWFGWKRESIIDLGDISTARGSEMLLPIWLRLMAALQSPMFNFQIVKAPRPQA